MLSFTTLKQVGFRMCLVSLPMLFVSAVLLSGKALTSDPSAQLQRGLSLAPFLFFCMAVITLPLQAIVIAVWAVCFRRRYQASSRLLRLGVVNAPAFCQLIFAVMALVPSSRESVRAFEANVMSPPPPSSKVTRYGYSSHLGTFGSHAFELCFSNDGSGMAAALSEGGYATWTNRLDYEFTTSSLNQTVTRLTKVSNSVGVNDVIYRKKSNGIAAFFWVAAGRGKAYAVVTDDGWMRLDEEMAAAQQ